MTRNKLLTPNYDRGDKLCWLQTLAALSCG